MLHHRTENGQRGVVLLLALIALLLISAVGAAIIYMASSESGFVGSQRLSARAFYAAVSGLEEARYRLLPANQATGVPPLGVNYTNPLAVVTGTGPVIPCNALPAPGPSEQAGTLVPCNTASVIPFPARPWNALYIMDSPAPYLGPGSNPGAPTSATNDASLTNEIPIPIVNATGSLQPGVGTAASIPWSWVRINLKTERASGEDINLDGMTTDDEPIFYYQTRQYRLADLLPLVPSVLPPPWGPPPTPDSGRTCVATVCAAPVYMLTAFATIPGVAATGRVVRSEVAALPSFSMNAAILSLPPIQISGTSEYYGYDGCDPDCAGFPPGTPPATCSTIIPLQSAAPAGSNVSGNSSDTYPPPPCPPPGTGTAKACVQQNVPFTYNVDELINTLRPMATPLAPGGYTGLKIGGFPFTDPINGTGAEPVVTYVGGDFKCTGGCSGAGILIVDGNFDFNASMEFYGIIIVRGNVSVLGGGSPTTGCNIYGALLSGGTVQSTLGGSICFRYNTCAQRNQFATMPLLTLSLREMPQ